VALLNEKRAGGLTVEVFSSKRLGELKSHGKIMLIDDVKVVVGSLALAALSLDFRREVAIVVDEPSAVAEAVELFRGLAAAAAEAQAGTAALGETAPC
jgi:phosphatidylserine/phosphatidylglycerophosphate/cardiolipin synthase-like enzyme